MPRKVEWLRGHKAAIARAAGISHGHLSDILRGRRTPSAEVAAAIEAASAQEGAYLSRFDLLYWAESHNPLLDR